MIYAVAMGYNALFAYDLTGEGDILKGKAIGPLVKGAVSTDCRAMCVDPDGTVLGRPDGDSPRTAAVASVG
jgi:hypothetical protein